MTNVDTPTVHDSLFKVESDWLSDLIAAVEYAEALGLTEEQFDSWFAL